jgi:RNA polymerase sigma-70 factor (ECF subfamily)
VIKRWVLGHEALKMTEQPLSLGLGALELPAAAAAQAPQRIDEGSQETAIRARLVELVNEHLDMLWRFLRQLGIPECDIDDGVQEVLVVAARKLDRVQPGSERAFLFGTALRVASTMRRTRNRRRETVDDALLTLPDPTGTPEDAVDGERARRVLSALLNQMQPNLRAVFVLYEIEELTMAEISELLELAPGTVASRLRRARAVFERKSRVLQAECSRRRMPP